MPKPAHYRGTYHVRARRIRDEARANPATTCWRCGRLAIPGDDWQAGHLRDSDPDSPLAPEHRSCNARAGLMLRLQQEQKQTEKFQTSKKWR